MTGAYRLAATLSLAAAMTVAGAVHAQPPPPPPPPSGGGAQQPDLSALLHLRPDQQGALHAYQSAIRPSPDEIGQQRQASAQTLSALATPERLDRISALLNLQQQIFHRSAVATRAFYNQLSPDQQRTFDRVSAPTQGGGRRGPQG